MTMEVDGIVGIVYLHVLVRGGRIFPLRVTGGLDGVDDDVKHTSTELERRLSGHQDAYVPTSAQNPAVKPKCSTFNSELTLDIERHPMLVKLSGMVVILGESETPGLSNYISSANGPDECIQVHNEEPKSAGRW